MKILVSACLLGIPCRYDGQSKANTAILALAKQHTLIPFCPEIYGGLATPRQPAEIVGDRVCTQSGIDVTEAYRRGAEQALHIAKLLDCECAVLQDRSPSCGSGLVHDGTFQGGLTEGDGVTAALLKANGVRVLAASEAAQALQTAEQA